MTGVLLAAAVGKVQAQEHAKQHRIAIVVPAGPIAAISDTGSDPIRRREYQAFFEELRRLGDVEGQNLTIERYSGEGRREAYADLAREVVGENPEAIVAQYQRKSRRRLRAASTTIPIVWIGVDGIQVWNRNEPGAPWAATSPASTVYRRGTRSGESASRSSRKPSLRHPKSHSCCRAGGWEGAQAQLLREMSRRLEISLIPMLLRESTPTEYQRVFAEIAPERPDAIIVHDTGDLVPYLQLIVELIAQSRLPAMYGYRDYVEAGGLMAYEADLSEAGRRMADDVHQILSGTKPEDIPIYQASKFDLAINLKTAKALGLAIPPALLAAADGVIE